MRAFKNWWYYHKWYVIGGILLIIFLFRRAGHALGWFEKKPDLMIAYVAAQPLPEDTACAVENAFAALTEDINGDGTVLVQVSRYASSPSDGSVDTLRYRYAQEVRLIGDIESGDSFLFLTDDPDALQRDYRILAAADGSEPAESDKSGTDKCIRWADCPLLAGQELGNYRENTAGVLSEGSNQDFLADFYLGRRFFSPGKKEPSPQLQSLWERLSGAAGA